MNIVREYLRDVENYSLRERFNVYAGAIEGLLLAPTIMYFAIDPAFEMEKNAPLWVKFAKGGLATLLSIPFIPASFLTGTMVGIKTANKLKKKRLEREADKRCDDENKQYLLDHPDHNFNSTV